MKTAPQGPGKSHKHPLYLHFPHLLGYNTMERPKEPKVPTSVTSGEVPLSNAVRISGAASLALSQTTEGPQTRAGIEEPAAVVSKSLEQLNTAAAEARIAGPTELRARSNGAATLEGPTEPSLNERTTEAVGDFAERVQTEITTSAEIAVLAQAQQLPMGLMPYSGGA